jgi:SWI/SNF-related matrix-associated actin-dependent regulator 1 of chromatin subfamily A
MVRRLKKDVLKDLPPKRRQLVMLEDSKVDWAKHPQFKRWREVYEKQHEMALAQLEAAKTDADYKNAVLALEKFTGIAFEEMSKFRHETALVKLPLALQYIQDLLESGVENMVIFAHHVDVLQKIYQQFREDAVMVSGGVSEKARESAVRDFQAKKKRIFVGQTRAAGVGITLTAANVVVFVESDWVPGVLSQAEDRLCRIGQKKMVHVIHLVLGNTLDSNMTKRVVEKQAIIDKALDTMAELKMKPPVQSQQMLSRSSAD